MRKNNIYKIFYNFKKKEFYVKIYFKNSDKVCFIDFEDLKKVKEYHWRIHKVGFLYYIIHSSSQNGITFTIYLHKLLFPNSKIVDHKDGNGLNNRKYNLRDCTNKQNLRNSCKRRSKTSSKYKGVSKRKGNRWRTQITVDNLNIHLGSFKSEVEAAECYDIYAKEYFGEFARTNF